MPQLVTSGLKPGDDERICELFGTWDEGPIADTTFTRVFARAIPQPIVEVVVLREKDGVIETVVIPRPDRDPVWPGMWHTPGTAKRKGDFSHPEGAFQASFDRVKRELGVTELTTIFVGNHDHLTKRGPESSEVFIGLVASDIQLAKGVWVPAAQLADRSDFIQHQLPFVEMAVDYYERHLLMRPGLSEDEVRLLVELLRRIPQGQLDPRVYEALALLTPQDYGETVVCRRRADGKIEVLLLRRRDEKAAFFGMLHSPGSALRNSDFDRYPDYPFKGALERVQGKELNTRFIWVEFVGVHFYPRNERGTGIGNIHVAEIAQDAVLPEGAQWVAAEALAELPDLVPPQLPMIQKAVAFYRQLGRR